MVLDQTYKILQTEASYLDGDRRLKYGALITLVIFHCPETIYFERNDQRRYGIPEDVLLKQIESLEFPELDEGDRTIIVDEQGNILATYPR